jgi:hypothetical protein
LKSGGAPGAGGDAPICACNRARVRVRVRVRVGSALGLGSGRLQPALDELDRREHAPG